MRLYEKESGLEIAFQENAAHVIYLENKETYTHLLENLWEQSNGREGSVIITEDDKEINLSKNAVMIFNPFAVSCNEKKILTKLYAQIKETADEEFMNETAAVIAANIQYLDNLLEKQEYGLEYKLDYNVLDVLKIFDVRLQESEGNIIDRLADYVKICGRICNIKLFIFVGLRNYFMESQLLQLYQEMFNEKIHILDIEASYEKAYLYERSWILDRDMCIIKL